MSPTVPLWQRWWCILISNPWCNQNQRYSPASDVWRSLRLRLLVQLRCVDFWFFLGSLLLQFGASSAMKFPFEDVPRLRERNAVIDTDSYVQASMKRLKSLYLVHRKNCVCESSFVRRLHASTSDDPSWRDTIICMIANYNMSTAVKKFIRMLCFVNEHNILYSAIAIQLQVICK